MLNILTSLIYCTSAELCSAFSRVGSFLGAAVGGNFALTLLINIGKFILDWILRMIWVIEKCVLGIMEALEFIVNRFLGIGVSIDELVTFGSQTDLMTTLVKTFRAIAVVALVLLIIFTVIAIIRQEWSVANSADFASKEEKNNKAPIIKKMFLGIMSIIVLPFAMIAIIGAVNAVLTAFNNALKAESNTTIAGQVLATSTYDTNKYRQYANNNKRMPIIIEAYNVNDYKVDETRDLMLKIKSMSVQSKLKNTAANMGNNMVLTFDESVTYSNNKLTNNSTYADYYEKFVCTAEQYQVMADFIDYAELTNTNFYIKAIDDSDIEWKYVDSSVFNAKDMSLTISYKDANDLNNNGNKNDTYSVTYAMGYEVTSPISNALDSISALLGLNEYSDFTYNEMERESDSINVVHWANEKVSLHFSENFDIHNMQDWTATDEILMYEYHHFSSNNTLSSFTLDDLSFANKGKATLDAYKITYKDYYPDADAYSKERYIYCVYINGTYYRVEQSEVEVDSWGNKFYVLSELDGVKFLDKAYSILSVQNGENAELKFTGKGSGFNLNDAQTWSYTDQIIMYEYYKDLSYNNNLSRYDISNFGTGVDAPVYLIQDYDRNGNKVEKRYALLNGTYYELTSPSGSGGKYVLKGADSSNYFLERIDGENSISTSTYGYSGNSGNIVINDRYNNYGITTNDGTNKTPDDFIIDSSDDIFGALSSNIDYFLDEDIDLSLTFSKKFDFRDVDSWTYKDYFLFYLYNKYLIKSPLTIDSLKYTSLGGTIGKYNNEYYFRIQKSLTQNNDVYTTVFLKVNDINKISTKNIRNAIDAERTFTYEKNTFSVNNELVFVNVDNPNTVFAKVETEYKDFIFSIDVSREDVSSWTMGDYILFILESKNIISISTNLSDYTYSSVCYKGVGIGNGLTTNLYGFGLGSSKVYLNERYILSLGYENLDEWLGTNFISFVSKILSNGSTYQKLVLEENEIVKNLIDSTNFSERVYSFYEVIEELVKNYSLDIRGDEHIFDIYDQITRYSYVNNDFEFNDLSTWTIFDFALYVYTGSVSGSYSNYVVRDGDTNRFIIGKYAVSLAGGSAFESNLKQSASISSVEINLEGKTLSQYYNERLSGKILRVNKADNTFYRANNFDYSYTKTAGMDTAFDAILEGNGFGSSSSFNLYTDGTDNYLLLGLKSNQYYFLKVDRFGLDGTATLSQSATIELSNAEKPFAKDSIHTTSPFKSSSVLDSDYFKDTGYSMLDAIIYELTGIDAELNLQVYYSANISGKKFIVINGNFIEFNTNNIYKSAYFNESSSLSNSLDILYSTYYNRMVMGNLEAVGDETTAVFNSTFRLDDIDTWTPLNIILYKLGVIDGTADASISGEFSTTPDGNRRYFTFTYVNLNGASTTYNILVTDIADIVEIAEDSYTLNEMYNSVVAMKLRAVLTINENYNINDANSVAFIAPEDTIEKYLTLNNVINNYIKNYSVTSYSSNIWSSNDSGQVVIPDVMSSGDNSSWNWIDIINYYLFDEFRSSDSFEIYVDYAENGSVRYTYIKLENGNDVKYIRFSNVIFDLISGNKKYLSAFATETERVEFSLEKNDVPLIAAINYQYTQNLVGNVDSIVFDINGDKKRIYLITDSVTAENVFIYSTDIADAKLQSSISNSKYVYTVNGNKTNVSEWNILDLAIKVAAGNVFDKAETKTSNIYTFNGRRYFYVNGRYIDLTLLNISNIPGDQPKTDADGNVTYDDVVLPNTNIRSAITFVGFNENTITSTNSSRNFQYTFISLRESNVTEKTIDFVVNKDPNMTDEEYEALLRNPNEVRLKFSTDFDFSDYSTWKNADFLLYYLFVNGHMCDKHLEDDVHTADCITNFQHYVSQGYIPAFIYFITSYDEFGSVTITKVYKIGEGETRFGNFDKLAQSSVEEFRDRVTDEAYASFINNIAEFNFINFDLWEIQYNREVNTILTVTNSDADLIIVTNGTGLTNQGFKQFSYSYSTTRVSKDLPYDNYYYFNFKNTDDEFLNGLKASSSYVAQITSGGAQRGDLVNLRLSDGFDIKDVSTWTTLDYILIYEFSKGGRMFMNTSFAELKDDYFVYSYEFKAEGETTIVIGINGEYYDVTEALDEEVDTRGMVSGSVESSDITQVYSYNFRVKTETINFILNRSREQISRVLVKTDDSLAYSTAVGDKNFTYFKKLDSNVAMNYYVDLSTLATYTISPMVKQVNWVQKIMNDMMVMYPDLNWATLIATDGWLDTLGEYHSAYASGQFIESGNSANITAAGMVLSEFLLSVANRTDTGYADYEYSSVFDEDVIEALMLTMLGEKEFETVKLQAEIFVEMYNVAFAGVLDDIAAERGLEIVDGEVSNFVLSVYKSYLATVLLSSDFGEYLYTIATRVYAQYAIYESLAFASGDYSSYYAYINGLTDANGDVVDAFRYATFKELVMFENNNLNPNGVPTYTFNYPAVYRSLVNPNATDQEIAYSLNYGDKDSLLQFIKYLIGDDDNLFSQILTAIEGFLADNGINNVNNLLGTTINAIINLINLIPGVEIPIPKSFDDVLSDLNKEYEKVYIPHRGCTDKIKSNDPTRYSYMLDVYWSIRQDLNNNRQLQPVYLKIYKDYIDGDIDRWQIESDISINSASNYIQNYNWYKLQRGINKISFVVKYMKMFSPDLQISIEDESGIQDAIDSVSVGNMSVDMKSVVYRLSMTFGSSSTYKAIFREVFSNDYLAYGDIIKFYSKFSGSEDGSSNSWNEILKLQSNLEKMLDELTNVMDVAPGEQTINGSTRAGFTTNVYQETYNDLFSLYEAVGSYISTQQLLDKIEKGSITFTLAQFGNNYVESGFDFTLQNREYNLKSSISTKRLAEYVYGGAFLDQFGVYAQFTSPTFEGVVHSSKAVDPNDNYVKTKLTCFEELRTFAGSIANYTGKLYFLTNLKDLSANVSDSVILTDYVYNNTSYIGRYLGNETATYKTTPEYLLLDHIITDEELLPDTLVRLIFGDSVESLDRMGCSDSYITLLAKYLEGTTSFTDLELSFMGEHSTSYTTADNGSIASLTDEFKLTAIRRYLVYVQTTSSNIKHFNENGTIEYLSGREIDGLYGFYQSNGYSSAGYYCDGLNNASDRIHLIFKNVISYLTISTEQAEERDEIGVEGEFVSFDNMNFKDLKSYLTKSLVDYEKNEAETGAENSARYLTLFNLVSGQFNYFYADGDGTSLIGVGTTLSKLNNYTEVNTYSNQNGLVHYQDELHGTIADLYVTFNIDRSTRGTILKLCGIENRPIEELVNLEYDELYQRDGSYDEADGDVFIVCSYDEVLGKYIPFLATNRKYSGTFGGTNYYQYLEDYGYRIFTNFYDSPTNSRFAYPIIAKGIINADLKPTAIRIQNNVAQFYRTDITATTRVEDDALQRVNASVETTTVGYVKYVNVTSFSNVANTNESHTMYIGSSDIMSYVNSNAAVYYIQYNNIYNLSKTDIFDGISVLDEFSAFFTMSMQMHIMMILGFITLVPLLFKASGAVLRRILDMIFLVLAGPLCIAMNSINYTDEEHNAYKQWKKYMISTLFSVFGLVISFNLYFIMVSTTMNMTFIQEGDATMQKIDMIGGLSFVTAPLLNAFIRFIFIVVATNMIETAADMLLNVITGGKVTSSYGSALANGENAITSITNLAKSMKGDLSKTLNLARDVVSGKVLVEAKNALIESLPGSAIVSDVKEKVGGARNYLKSREIYKKAKEKGVNPIVARAAAKEFRNNYKKQRNNIKQRRQQQAQSFYGRFGMQFGGKK